MEIEIGQKIGKYVIKGLLGGGAVGTVWLGYDDDLERYVAIKVLKSEFKDDPSIREHFRKEAKATAKLEHPNIVKIYYTNFSDDVDYIVMEFVSPNRETVKTLDDLLKENEGKLPPEITEQILVQLSEALALAHSQNVLHCDIKPSNILVGELGQVKLSDFGLAKVAKEIEAQTENIVIRETLRGKPVVEGTIGYMPPEVEEGKNWTKAGDVYSLGMVIYRTLTGKRAVGRWKLPSELIDSLSVWWDEILGQCLESEPEDRYADGNSLLSSYNKRYRKEQEEKERSRIKTERELIEKRQREDDEKRRIEAEQELERLNKEIALKKQQLTESENRQQEPVDNQSQMQPQPQMQPKTQPSTEPKNDKLITDAKAGDIITFGKYKWRVLDVQNSKALILSDMVLERRYYNEEYEVITWEQCTLRKYLNGEFLNSFSADEKSRIAETTIKNDNNQWYGTNGGNTTKDRIFLLSLEEVVKYFGDSGQLKNRKKDQLYIDDKYNTSRIAYDTNNEACWWWLRSPGNYGGNAAHVSFVGGVGVYGHFVDGFSGGVRPALWLNL